MLFCENQGERYSTDMHMYDGKMASITEAELALISLAFWKLTEILRIKTQAPARMKLFCAKIWVTTCVRVFMCSSFDCSSVL